MTGYAYVDESCREMVRTFLPSAICSILLELNRRVLCGIDETVRQDSVEHLRAVEEHFYNAPGAGIRDIVEMARKAPCRSRAEARGRRLHSNP